MNSQGRRAQRRAEARRAYEARSRELLEIQRSYGPSKRKIKNVARWCPKCGEPAKYVNEVSFCERCGWSSDATDPAATPAGP